MPGSILTAVGVFAIGVLVSMAAIIGWYHRGRMDRMLFALGIGCLLLGAVLLVWTRLAIA